LILCFTLGFIAFTGYAEDWYVSNAGGMALEPAFSRAALRSKYALSVGTASLPDLPGRLRKYYDPSYRIELRCLYEEGLVTRRQWSFRDAAELARLAAVFEDDNSGFIELYNADKLISESHQISADGSDYITYYFYNNSVLLRAETRLYTPFLAEAETPPEGTDMETAEKATVEPEAAVSATALTEPVLAASAKTAAAEPEAAASATAPTEPVLAASAKTAAAEPEVAASATALAELVPAASAKTAAAEPAAAASATALTEPVPVTAAKREGEGTEEPVWTDYYRYNRSYGLRSVERRFYRTPAADQETAFYRSPQHILGVVAESEFVKPGSVFSSDFFEDVIINSGDRILYSTDARGRILRETRRDENDTVLGEVINTWSGDRLDSVLWKSETEERLIEYDYNDQGDRIFERNFRDGVLERTVRRNGEREVEELYMNGVVILRAIWEDGRKISEERVRPNGDRL
jgi:hypothetical protein